MTNSERKAMRKKHRKHHYQRLDIEVCFFCSDIDFVGRVTSYPCEVIKVLDATEPVSETDPKCQHNIGLHLIPRNPEKPVDLPYCPHFSASDTSDVLPTDECNHQHIGISHVDLDGVEEWFEHYAYCPKCGEKL